MATVVTVVIQLNHPLLVHSPLSLSQCCLSSENKGTRKTELHLSDIHSLIYEYVLRLSLSLIKPGIVVLLLHPSAVIEQQAMEFSKWNGPIF